MKAIFLFFYVYGKETTKLANTSVIYTFIYIVDPSKSGLVSNSCFPHSSKSHLPSMVVLMELQCRYLSTCGIL